MKKKSKGSGAGDEYEELKDGSKVPKTTGLFHLGLQYDINIWSNNNQSCRLFPC
jgi:hypothetical protein